MGKLLELKLAESLQSTILIETTEVEDEFGIVQAGGTRLSFEEMIQTVKPFCESIITTFKDLSVKPTSASAEFGLTLSAEGNMFIVKASGEATLKLTLNWSLK